MTALDTTPTTVTPSASRRRSSSQSGVVRGAVQLDDQQGRQRHQRHGDPVEDHALAEGDAKDAALDGRRPIVAEEVGVDVLEQERFDEEVGLHRGQQGRHEEGDGELPPDGADVLPAAEQADAEREDDGARESRRGS